MKTFKWWQCVLFLAAFEAVFLITPGCDDDPGQQDAGTDGTVAQQDGGGDGTCTPSCSGAACGDDNGCGGKCVGTCATGTCNPATYTCETADVCAPYEPLDGWEDGWSCNKGSNPLTCVFSLDIVSGACYLLCNDTTVGDGFRCPPPASFSHSASWKSFTCTSLSGSQVSCSR